MGKSPRTKRPPGGGLVRVPDLPRSATPRRLSGLSTQDHARHPPLSGSTPIQECGESHEGHSFQPGASFHRRPFENRLQQPGPREKGEVPRSPGAAPFERFSGHRIHQKKSKKDRAKNPAASRIRMHVSLLAGVPRGYGALPCAEDVPAGSGDPEKIHSSEVFLIDWIATI
jgi:hypothetical protein